MCPRRGRDGWVGTYWSDLITDPVALIYGCGGREKEKRSGASNQSREWVDRWRDRKRDAEHVPPCSFTQRLRSMLTLIPHFSLDQPSQALVRRGGATIIVVVASGGLNTHTSDTTLCNPLRHIP